MTDPAERIHKEYRHVHDDLTPAREPRRKGSKVPPAKRKAKARAKRKAGR